MKIQSLLVLYLFFCGCTTWDCAEKETLAFDDWQGFDKGFRPVGCYKSEAPHKKFSADVLYPNPDADARSLLRLVYLANGQRVTAGRSIRDIKTTWVETQLGDLLLVENQKDTHFTESLVLFPRIDQNGKLTFTTLYATPNQDICVPKGVEAYPEHINPKIKHVSYDGIMTIEIMWHYILSENTDCGMTTKIPLFYGVREKHQPQNPLHPVNPVNPVKKESK